MTSNVRLSINIIYVPQCQLSERMNDSLRDKFQLMITFQTCVNTSVYVITTSMFNSSYTRWAITVSDYDGPLYWSNFVPSSAIAHIQQSWEMARQNGLNLYQLFKCTSKIHDRLLMLTQFYVISNIHSLIVCFCEIEQVYFGGILTFKYKANSEMNLYISEHQ